MKVFDKLKKNIINKKAKLGVIGIGYVGSALAEAASNSGIEVVGFTRSEKKAEKINKSKIYNFKVTSDISEIRNVDIISVCVPTPVYPDKKPDLRPIEESIIKTTIYLRKGHLVILESSVAPGTTRFFALPILLKSGLQPEKDFFLAFSPERVDPGNKKFTIANTPKIISGLGEKSKKLTALFYKSFIKKVVPVSSLETAEMAKILENTYRLVNISLINELKKYTNSIGVDMWETVEAAATKPFGFMAHCPGPGIGGHCIPVDPYYLIDDAKKIGIRLNIVEEAGKVNDAQPLKVVDKALKIINERNGKKKKNEILLVGVTYKPNVDDIRESPALKIWEIFEENGFNVSYYDPYVPHINGFKSISWTSKDIKRYDLVIITTNHNSINYEKILKIGVPVLDTRNVFNGISYPNIFFI